MGEIRFHYSAAGMTQKAPSQIRLRTMSLPRLLAAAGCKKTASETKGPAGKPRTSVALPPMRGFRLFKPGVLRGADQAQRVDEAARRWRYLKVL